VTQSVYLSNNAPHFDCINKSLDILPEAVNWAALYAEVNRNYKSMATIKVVFVPHTGRVKFHTDYFFIWSIFCALIKWIQYQYQRMCNSILM
jgi:hypothetical protein